MLRDIAASVYASFESRKQTCIANTDEIMSAHPVLNSCRARSCAIQRTADQSQTRSRGNDALGSRDGFLRQH